jgi:hypothetical protein
MSFNPNNRTGYEPYNYGSQSTGYQQHQYQPTFNPYQQSTYYQPPRSIFSPVYPVQQPSITSPYQQQQTFVPYQEQQRLSAPSSPTREFTPMSEYTEEKEDKENENERFERIGDSIIVTLIDEQEYLPVMHVIRSAIDTAGEPKTYETVMHYLDVLGDVISRGVVDVNDQFELKYIEP